MLSLFATILAASAVTAQPAATPPSAPAPHARHTQDTIPLERAFLLANPWAPAGLCADKVTFRSDGTALMGDTISRWRLEGGMLILAREGTPEIRVGVERRGGDIVMTMGGDSQTISACPAD